MSSAHDNDQVYRSSPESRLEEIDELVGLAEDITSRIELLERAISSVRARLVISISGVYGAMAIGLYLFYRLSPMPQSEYFLNEPVALIGLVGAVGAIISYAYTQFRFLSRARNDLEVEVRLLGELLELISGLMNSIDSETSVVKQAVLMMRLRRIKFTEERLA